MTATREMQTINILKAACAAFVLFGAIGTGIGLVAVQASVPVAGTLHDGQDKTAPAQAVLAPDLDARGDPLPAGAFMRLGTSRLRHGKIKSIAWSSDGTWLASAASGDDAINSVRLWDAATGKEIRTFQKHRSAVCHVAISPDDTRVASVDQAGTLLLWEAATGKMLGTRAVDPGAVAVFASDGKTLASIDNQSQACLISTANLETLRVIKAGPGLQTPVTNLAWCKDGKWLATLDSANKLRLITMLTGVVQHSLAGAAKVECLSFTPDGKTLAAGGLDKGIQLWDVASGKMIRRLDGHEGEVVTVAWSPDGKFLASGSPDKTARVWDVAKGQQLLKFTRPFALVHSVAFSPDGKLVASGGSGGDNEVHIWDMATGKETIAYDEHIGWVGALALRDGGQTLLSSARDDKIRLWDLASGKSLGQFDAPHMRAKAISMSADGKLLATGGGDGTIRVLALPRGDIVQEFRVTGKQPNVYSLAIAPDGKSLVSCSYSFKVLVWDVATGTVMGELNHPPERVSAVAFSPDGKTLVTGGAKGSIRLWNMNTRQEMARLGGHKEYIEAIGFCADGKFAASVSMDSTACLWDLATGKASLAFRDDNKALLSGGADSTILCWDLTGRGKDKNLSAKALSAEDLDAQWDKLLGDDVGQAFQAMWTLAARPGEVLGKLQKTLQPAKAVDAKVLAKLIADLDDAQFTVREKALTELKKIGDTAWPALKKVESNPPSLETQARVRTLLGNQDDPLLPIPGRLVQIRSLELLERLDTLEARKFIQTLGDGAPEAWLTQEAKAMLKRRK